MIVGQGPVSHGMGPGLFYRRHSGLRTIRGGICSGGRLRLATLRQLRLLGYQRIVSSLAFWRKLSFVSLPNMGLLPSPSKNHKLSPSSLSANPAGDFHGNGKEPPPEGCSE